WENRESLRICPRLRGFGRGKSPPGPVLADPASARESRCHRRRRRRSREPSPSPDRKGSRFSAGSVGACDWRPPSSNHPAADCSAIPPEQSPPQKINHIHSISPRRRRKEPSPEPLPIRRQRIRNPLQEKG